MASVVIEGTAGRSPGQHVLTVLRPLDREVFALALPALGALAAEPLYVLVDTAIVGHLGTTQLAALAIAATVLSTGFTILNFLTYGTTAQVARLHGAGRDRDAAALGSQALWLALILGFALLVGTQILAPGAVELMGGEDEVADGAVLYLRIAAIGGPFFMIAAAGQGFLRGIGDLRTPLRDPRRRPRRQRGARAAVRLRLRLGPGRLGVGHGDRPGRHGAGLRRGPAPRRLRAADPRPACGR